MCKRLVSYVLRAESLPQIGHLTNVLHCHNREVYGVRATHNFAQFLELA